MPEFKTAYDVISWLIAGPGAVSVTAAFVSVFLAKLTFWNRLSGDLKVAIVFLLPFAFFVPSVYAALHLGLVTNDQLLDKIFTGLLWILANQYTYNKAQKAGMVRAAPQKK